MRDENSIKTTPIKTRIIRQYFFEMKWQSHRNREKKFHMLFQTVFFLAKNLQKDKHTERNMKQKQRIWSKFICDDLFVACLILCCVATYFRKKNRFSWPCWRVFFINLRWNLSTKFGRVPVFVYWWISIEHDGGVFIFWFIHIWLIRPGTEYRCHTCTYLINFNVNFM